MSALGLGPRGPDSSGPGTGTSSLCFLLAKEPGSSGPALAGHAGPGVCVHDTRASPETRLLALASSSPALLKPRVS